MGSNLVREAQENSQEEKSPELVLLLCEHSPLPDPTPIFYGERPAPNQGHRPGNGNYLLRWLNIHTIGVGAAANIPGSALCSESQN